jgi:hypothetical protein
MSVSSGPAKITNAKVGESIPVDSTLLSHLTSSTEFEGKEKEALVWQKLTNTKQSEKIQS